MPRYFFDIDDGGRSIPGTVGIDLDVGEIGREAKSLLHPLGVEHLLARRPGRIQLMVRDDEGRGVYLSTIDVKVL